MVALVKNLNQSSPKLLMVTCYENNVTKSNFGDSSLNYVTKSLFMIPLYTYQSSIAHTIRDRVLYNILAYLSPLFDQWEIASIAISHIPP